MESNNVATTIEKSTNGEEGKRCAFGNRFLRDPDAIFEHNAWDAVEWDKSQELDAQERVKANSTIHLDPSAVEELNKNAESNWNTFYNIHENRFFKDRHWLFTEFPQLNDSETILEIGCGVGNTVYPICQYSNCDNVVIYCCDFSQKALDVLKANEDFDCDRIKPFYLDITETNWSVPFEENSLDIILVVFVLSSINPNKFPTVVKNIYKYLKIGGKVLFRDYGRYDMTQLRFKPGRSIGDNFYVRGDNTMVYFFTQCEIKELFQKHHFIEDYMYVDRRLQVNRGRQLKMYRIWIQAVFIKR